MTGWPESLASGAVLHDCAGHRHARGDLSRVGGALVFTAETDRTGVNPVWIDGDPPASEVIVRVVRPVWFERRGVLVVPADVVQFNERADQQIRPHWRPSAP